jgi:hypothetical protein
METTSPPKPKLDCSGSFPEVLEKHKKYQNSYGRNELFWGLGIECESYLEMKKPVLVKAGFIINNHKRERYSVDYYTSYKEELCKCAFAKFTPVKEEIPLPLLVNSHALTKMDVRGEHQTLYLKDSPPNPKFSGKTIFEELQNRRPEYFKDQYEKKFTFDGDSIEIMTQNFYKTKVENVMSELYSLRAEFLENLHEALEGWPEMSEFKEIHWMSGNHGLAVMATNPNNLAIFNNGTYHINITLPTFLDEKGKIKNWPAFVDLHKQYCLYIQWIEPLLVGVFGSPDPLEWLLEGSYSAGSQRCAMSRYIGIGSYDTTKMERGKILTIDLSGVRTSWYQQFHKKSGYVPLNKIGLDINFNKHWNHGVELRFFDWFPEERLRGLLKVLVWIGDIVMQRACKASPVDSKIWNAWTARVMKQGAAAGLRATEAADLSRIYGFEWKPCNDLNLVFADMYSRFSKQYGTDGPCSTYFLSDGIRPVREVDVVGAQEIGCCCLPAPKQVKNLESPRGRGGGSGGNGTGISSTA